jgi:glycerol-3-phosphate dehydrogenase
MSRLSSLTNTIFDLVIIGGGIIGAGIARDAAMRGLSVALFEKADFGGGTTAGSTRLIHGGLRYLEMLDFRLVRVDLREREVLLRIAPHLVKPLPFVLPFYDRSLIYRWRMRAGLWLYDVLSYDKTLPNRRMLTVSDLRAQEPRLADQRLQGAASYFDAQASLPERLCIENIIAASESGARTLNYAEVVGALHEDGRLRGVRVRDVLNGEMNEPVDVRAKLVVNAAGPWFDRVASRLAATGTNGGVVPPRRIRTTKGIHLAMPAMTQSAMVLFSPIDGRLIFVIPWLGYSWIGTTDTDFSGDPADALATAEDVDYMLASVKPFFPEVDRDRIFFTNAGVRALVQGGGSESSVSRQHQVMDGAEAGALGLVAVLGSKLTAYRAIAEEATDRVCKLLGVARPCRTADVPLPGARADGSATVPATPHAHEHASAQAQAHAHAQEHAHDQEPEPAYEREHELALHLDALYGTRARDVLRVALDDALQEPLSPSYPDIAAQVRVAVRQEHCLRLVDFMFRRTCLGFTTDQGVSAAEPVAMLMAGELGWTAQRTVRELALYAQTVARTQAFRRSASSA